MPFRAANSIFVEKSNLIKTNRLNERLNSRNIDSISDSIFHDCVVVGGTFFC